MFFFIPFAGCGNKQRSGRCCSEIAFTDQSTRTGWGIQSGEPEALRFGAGQCSLSLVWTQNKSKDFFVRFGRSALQTVQPVSYSPADSRLHRSIKMAAISHGTILNNKRVPHILCPVFHSFLYLWHYFLDIMGIKKPKITSWTKSKLTAAYIVSACCSSPLIYDSFGTGAHQLMWRLSDFNRRRTHCCLPQSHHIALGKLVLWF